MLPLWYREIEEERWKLKTKSVCWEMHDILVCRPRLWQDVDTDLEDFYVQMSRTMGSLVKMSVQFATEPHVAVELLLVSHYLEVGAVVHQNQRPSMTHLLRCQLPAHQMGVAVNLERAIGMEVYTHDPEYAPGHQQELQAC